MLSSAFLLKTAGSYASVLPIFIIVHTSLILWFLISIHYSVFLHCETMFSCYNFADFCFISDRSRTAINFIPSEGADIWREPAQSGWRGAATCR